jgi:hypothetical protein
MAMTPPLGVPLQYRGSKNSIYGTNPMPAFCVVARAGFADIVVISINGGRATLDAIYNVSYTPGDPGIEGCWLAPDNDPPTTVFSSISQASGVIPAVNFAAGYMTVLSQSGATALTTPTAAAILAAIPLGVVGESYTLRIINTNAGTLTITADASVTLTGTATIATNTWRDFAITLATAGTLTMQSIGTGTNS